MATLRAATGMDLLLTLTSPPMRGEHVRELQLTLRHNPYGIFEPGQSEDVYDEETAAAVRRAKYWLGYPESRVDESADALLLELLADESALPRGWKATRSKRLLRAERTMLWDAALDVAREELGRREDPPGSKQTSYTLWYGVLCPWSMIFPCYCYAQAGSRAFQPGSRYAYAPYLLDDARRGHNFLSLTTTPLRGDLALLDTDHDGVPERLAFFDGWEDDGTKERFDAIEGDVGHEGDTDGESSVARTKRVVGDVHMFVHVRA